MDATPWPGNLDSVSAEAEDAKWTGGQVGRGKKRGHLISGIGSPAIAQPDEGGTNLLRLVLLSQLANLEAQRSSLHSSFRFWEWMVVFGLGIDLVVIVKEYWDGLQDFRRQVIHTAERPSIVLLILGLLGTGLIAVGISRELSIDSRIEGLETRIRAVNEQLYGMVSDTAETAARASDRAKSIADAADAAAGSAQQKANAVGQTANELGNRLQEQDKLLRTMAPRLQLLLDDEDSMTKKLSRFKGQKVVIDLCGTLPIPKAPPTDRGELEKIYTWSGLEKILRDGPKWMSSHTVWHACFLSEEGITVWVSKPASKDSAAAARALSEELAAILPPQRDRFLFIAPLYCTPPAKPREY